MVFVSVGEDFFRVRERFDVLRQILDVFVPSLGLEFFVPCHVHDKFE